MRRITVSLAPAELKMEGAAYDLPMAVANLLAFQHWSAPSQLVMRHFLHRSPGTLKAAPPAYAAPSFHPTA